MQIRTAVAADADAIARVYAAYVLGTAISFEVDPPGADEVLRRMTARPRLPWLVADDGEVRGFAYASQHRARPGYRWAADCSVYVDGACRGRGLGRALYDVLIPAVRDLGYVTLHAGIALPNDASVRLHESFGFRPVGVYRDVGFKLDAWHDVGWWQLALRDPPDQPAEPREDLSAE